MKAEIRIMLDSADEMKDFMQRFSKFLGNKEAQGEIKVCRQCQREFHQEKKSQKLCPDCSRTHNADLASETMDEMQRNNPDIFGKSEAPGTLPGNSGKHGFDWVKEHPIPVPLKGNEQKPVLTLVCQECKNEFLSRRKTRFCSKKCYQRNYMREWVKNQKFRKTIDKCKKTGIKPLPEPKFNRNLE